MYHNYVDNQIQKKVFSEPISEAEKKINVQLKIMSILKKKSFWKFFDICFFQPIPINTACELLGSKEKRLSYNALNSLIRTVNKRGTLRIVQKIKVNDDGSFEQIQHGYKGKCERYLYLDFTDIFYETNWSPDVLDQKDCNNEQLSAKNDNWLKTHLIKRNSGLNGTVVSELWNKKATILNNPLFRLNLFLYSSAYYTFYNFNPHYISNRFYKNPLIKMGFDAQTKSYIRHNKEDAVFNYLTINFTDEYLFSLFNKLNLISVLKNKESKNILVFGGLPKNLSKLVFANKTNVFHYLEKIVNFNFDYIKEKNHKVKDYFVNLVFEYFCEWSSQKSKFHALLEQNYFDSNVHINSLY